MLETIKQINVAHAVINRPLPDEMKFRPSYEMSINEAKRTLVKLYQTLAEDVSTVAVPVYVSGANAMEISKAMVDQTPAAVVDLGEIYAPLVAAVKQTVGRAREFGVNQFAVVIRELRQLAVENGLVSIETPKFSEPVVFSSDSELRDIVLRYVNQSVGVELAVNFIRKQTGEQVAKVVKEKVPVFPVFILNCDLQNQESLTKKLFRRNIDVSVNAPDVVTEEAAISTLKTIKKHLKGNKE